MILWESIGQKMKDSKTYYKNYMYIYIDINVKVYVQICGL